MIPNEKNFKLILTDSLIYSARTTKADPFGATNASRVLTTTTGADPVEAATVHSTPDTALLTRWAVQADTGADLDILIGSSGAEVSRESH